ncbi:MAG: signal peptidase I [Gemmatimonadetes bacterium]|nr:signal peptidase I [Gemmatimonadota bacterium]
MIDGLGPFAGLIVLTTISMYPISLRKLYVKAVEPGWAVLIPIYNLLIWIRIERKPELWILILLLIPIANFIFSILISISFAKQFGKDGVWGIGMIILSFIFYPMLAFGDAEYRPEPVE